MLSDQAPDPQVNSVSKEQFSAEEDVGRVVRNFHSSFYNMMSPLKFGHVINADSGELQEVNDKDIRSYISTMIRFERYIEHWDEKDIDVSGFLKSTSGIENYLPEISYQLNLALETRGMLESTNFDAVQLIKVREVYFAYLKEAGKQISKMLKECFPKKI
jgi:hypothetical protein